MDRAIDVLLDIRAYGAIVGLAIACAAFLLLRHDPEQAINFAVSSPEPCSPGWKGKGLAEPSIKVPGSSAIHCYAPASGEYLGLVNPSSPDRIDRIVSRATEAQKSWSQTTFSQRRQVLKTLLKHLLENQATIIRAACLDSGKTRVDALFGEVLVTAEKLKWTIDHGEQALKPDRRPTNLLMFYKHNEVRYEPLGVVAACVSWNYPFHNLLGPIISAIFAGNAIVVKGSEQTAWSSSYFIDIVRQAIQACGHDPNIAHAISCWPQTADYFTSHPGLAHMTFIGSRPIAHEVAKSASKVLTPLCIELGGKDPAIVLDHPDGRTMSSAEIERVASIIMRGVFQSGGQNCVGIERVVAMPGAYATLVKLLEPRIRALRLGSDLDPDRSGDQAIDVGAMISPASFDRLEQLIVEARAQGARLLVGGHRHHHERYPHGHYYTPTLIVDVTPSMRIAQEELFGPVCVIMRAKDVTDAIDIANSTEYGLGASVFGPVSSSAARHNLSHVTDGVKAGMVAVNDFAAYYVVQLPFGGVRGSGYGRFAGVEGLRSLCNAKSVCKDKWPALIKTAIPANLDYPMRPDAWHRSVGVVEAGYGGLGRKWQGVRKLAGF
ncbi:Putative aldehyde dehydrogenase domain, aldehyde/histidinol dehydrogenase [Septoria linicola]|uniref:aldehyde dehydrogenase (NAD(+)) n=1 Tax=Septoria linicola TaxID=215465 RepID=A0A9Q9ACX1_9PEZI|nr:putative aldehyde dehydrogenase domain, aldehyde/histidinol dehydrogenase [Septoria linicola]USW47239.1 Putative aldehyde dehydrogenase domain, aldehyde/histidinol dehydrogenase [Septoria linicola]